MRPVVVIIVAYLIGSIPFGYLIVRLTGGGDVRETGSGGTGATNVSRRAGKAAGILTLLLDAAKGAFAVLATGVALGGNRTPVTKWWFVTAAVAVVAGHIFPVGLGFRGGKGVATAAGAFFMMVPFALLCAGIVFIAVVGLTRYVSLASVTAVALVPVFLLLQKLIIQPAADVKPPLAAAVVIALLIIFAHRGNIRRLISGTEPRFT